MQYCLFDDYSWKQLLPLTYTRSVSELRVGITTIKEKWEQQIGKRIPILTQAYLISDKVKESPYTYINSSIIPNPVLIQRISEINMGEALYKGDKLIAYSAEKSLSLKEINNPDVIIRSQWDEEIITIERPWDIFYKNDSILKSDFEQITNGRTSAPISSSNKIIGHQIFLEEGVEMEAAIINTKEGPVYLGKNSCVMEGAVIRGSTALCESSTIKLSAKIYGPTTIGPQSKIGGELNNVVFQGYSNKAHDGFLGNSVIGAWCNIGADTNTSNLKNNYAEVKLWSYLDERFIKTGLQFCGLIMGDHSKCGINTMFNTGTVIGVSANIFGAGFPRNYIPSFSWGGKSGLITYKFEKAIEVAEMVMERRDIPLSDADNNILKAIFHDTAKYRVWEK
jgi:UDP-N-acetylglucosamine diphosphorylase/glucosamine-1-phosphate N-acetyltransferase